MARRRNSREVGRMAEAGDGGIWVVGGEGWDFEEGVPFRRVGWERDAMRLKRWC